MKFDVVIGNPPYNDDIYLDFVHNGDKMSNLLVCMITPAKWAAKSGINNEWLRDIINYRGKCVVLYPESRDIFNIEEPDGVAYYCIVKHEQTNIQIINKCSRQERFNNEQYRKLEYSLNNTLNNLIKKIKINYDFKQFSFDTSRTYWLSSIQPEDIVHEPRNYHVEVYGGDNNNLKLLYGYYPIMKISNHVDDIDKYKLVMHFKLGTGYATIATDGTVVGLKQTIVYEPNQICKDSYMCLMCSNNLEEIKSLKAYLNTKLIRLLAYAGCCGTNASNPETWRFIPQPHRLDIEYTDEYLYKLMGIGEEDIEIIEALVKDRAYL